MRTVITSGIILFVVLFGVHQVEAATPTPLTAECDMCGYCPRNYPTPPGNWKACAECLYPQANLTPGSLDTLKIEPTTQNPPTPMPGRMYTMIGCIKTDAENQSPRSFNDPSGGAVATVTQALLNLLFRIVGGIAFIYLIYGAFLILTSQADPGRLNHGKRTVMGAIIGLAFALLSILIVRVIASGILRIPGFT